MVRWLEIGNVQSRHFNSEQREQIKKVLMNGGVPREIMGELPFLVFNGQLIKNKLMTVCFCRSYPLPPRFPLLVALMAMMRQFTCGEIVYQAFDHPFNIFLVVQGVFANCSRL